eukprot:scaffold8583_cov296-Pinguiococcus_pyrenoidosus.AAC.3
MFRCVQQGLWAALTALVTGGHTFGRRFNGPESQACIDAACTWPKDTGVARTVGTTAPFWA